MICNESGGTKTDVVALQANRDVCLLCHIKEIFIPKTAESQLGMLLIHICTVAMETVVLKMNENA